MERIRRSMERLFSAVTFAEHGDHDTARAMMRGDRRIVLAVTPEHPSPLALSYAVNAAQRNDARLDIVVLASTGRANARHEAVLSDEDRETISRASVPFRMIPGSGTVRETLMQHARREKNILFFVADPAVLAAAGGSAFPARADRLAEDLGRPLVQVEAFGKKQDRRSERERAVIKEARRKRPVGKMLVTGIVSTALYAALLANQDVLNSTFGKGGMYAFLPIAMAFLFSFIHGSFTGHFWTVLGIEAAKKKKEVQ